MGGDCSNALHVSQDDSTLVATADATTQTGGEISRYDMTDESTGRQKKDSDVALVLVRRKHLDTVDTDFHSKYGTRLVSSPVTLNLGLVHSDSFEICDCSKNCNCIWLQSQ